MPLRSILAPQNIFPADNFNFVSPDVAPDLKRRATAILESPGFDAALRAMAGRFSKAFAGSIFLSKIASEDARQLLIGCMAGLDLRRDIGNPDSGMTLGRVQEFSRRHGVSSPNRVAALMSLIYHSGFIEPASEKPLDRRVRRFQPSARGRAAMREWVTTFLVALSDVGICTAKDALPLAADDDLMAAVLATSVDLFFDGYHLLNAIPAIRVFTSKDVGYEAMLRLWAQLDPALTVDGQLMEIPYVRLAGDLGVSRAHIRRLIETAMSEGHMSHAGGNGRRVVVHQSFTVLMRQYSAFLLALYDLATERALIEVAQMHQDRDARRSTPPHPNTKR